MIAEDGSAASSTQCIYWAGQLESKVKDAHRRNLRLFCLMAFSGVMSIAKRELYGRQSDERMDEVVEDEFACAMVLRGSLMCLHGSVERIFGVAFGVGTDEGSAELPHSNNGQIWLNLRGKRCNVTAAKLFVRGVVNQEQQQEVSYPGVLHCVFCGARGLFMDSLIKNTSAHIVVGSLGCLLISGLMEPVVRAFSLITDLVERYEGTQGKRTDMGDRNTSDSLDSRRAFKSLVERWEDRHALDLLVLPGAVKESLLDLVRESGLGDSEERDTSKGTERQRIFEDISQLQLIDGTTHTRMGMGPEIRDFSSSALVPQPHSNRGHVLDVLPQQSGHLAKFPLQGNLQLSPSGTERWRGSMEPGGLQTNTATKDTFFRTLPVPSEGRGIAEGAEVRQVHSPHEVGEEGQPEEMRTMKKDEEEEGGDEGELFLSVGSKKEFRLLLKFFTAMGYTEDVVRRVLARTGPQEASQILDLIQQEQDVSVGINLPSETEHREGDGERETDEDVDVTWLDHRVGMEVRNIVDEGDSVRERETQRPSRGEEKAEPSAQTIKAEGEEGGSTTEEKGQESGNNRREDDFVLGVLKRAAASCGYTEDKVAEVYSMLPDLSTHQLLLELQRESSREVEARKTDSGREGPREVDEAVPVRAKERDGPDKEDRGRGKEPETQRLSTVEKKGVKEKEGGQIKDSGSVSVTPKLTTHTVDQDMFTWNPRAQTQQPLTNQPPSPKGQHQFLQSHAPHENITTEIRGPPLSTYPPALSPHFHNSGLHEVLPSSTPPPPAHIPNQPSPQPTYVPNPKSQIVHDLTPHPKASPPNYIPAPHPVEYPLSTTVDTPITRVSDRWMDPTMPLAPVVTGEQRFLEGLQMPFDLQLTDEPGDPGLRMIIIDGSNVAMSHGLGHFFSCRGIALAVQHFWSRGHRQIITFVPQWRQKRDPKGKEQHYLDELQHLGLLSYTPSREVLGKRINSYDDRFMLQLAQKTDGVIVTNDNLRDLLDESPVWRDIIKKRLLQYTFVGDHFMVPDDPLGRGGPHLDDFLRSQYKSPDPGHHSFAGIASSFPSSKPPRAKTEVLHFRDFTPGGTADPEFGGNLGRGKRQDWAGVGQHKQQRLGPGAGPQRGVERTIEETARLRDSLCQVFPGQERTVTVVLQTHPTETDVNALSYLILEQQD